MKTLQAMLAALLMVPAVHAAEVRLTDGTVVIGTILSMVDGDDLVVDTSHMGEVTIEWPAIVSVSGTQVVEVELFDGRKELGSVSVDEERGRLVVNSMHNPFIVQVVPRAEATSLEGTDLVVHHQVAGFHRAAQHRA